MPSWGVNRSDLRIGVWNARGPGLFFLVPFTIILVMQILVWRLLREVVPLRLRKALPWGLILLHAPLVAYGLIRFSGHRFHGVGLWLRPLAWPARYFQAISFVLILIWVLASMVWALWVRFRPKPGPEAIELGRRAFMRKATFGGLGTLAVVGGGGMIEAYGDPEISRFDLRFPDLPEGFEGFRILHLSDLHAGPLAGLKVLKRWRLLAERERPDVLIITGDFVDSLPEELDTFVEAFRDFSAPMGRFAILGNHDYFTDPVPIWAGLEAMGFHCLENRHLVLERNGSKMAILGLQDPMAKSGRFRGVHFGPGPMPQDVAARIPSDLWRLGLCHRPSNWNLALEAGSRLTLSGHTHGGQINLIPGVSSAKILGPYTWGIYRHSGDVLFVNRGLGVVGLPMRIAAPAEIAVITLRRQEIPSLHQAENQIT